MMQPGAAPEHASRKTYKSIIYNKLPLLTKEANETPIGIGLALGRAHVLPVSDDDF
jgi:hypothetical protein